MKLTKTSLIVPLYALLMCLSLHAQEYDVTVVPPSYARTLAKLFDAVSLNDGSLVYPNTAQHNVVRTFVDSAREGLVLGAGWRGESLNLVDVTQTFLNSPRGLATDGVQNVYVADSGNNRVLVADALAGVVRLVTTETLNNPTQVVRLGNGDILVLETSKHRVVRVDTAGKVTPFLGAGTRGKRLYSSSLLKSQLRSPQGMAHWLGRLIVADTGNKRLLEVDGNRVKHFGANTKLYRDYQKASSKKPNGVKALSDGSLVIREVVDNKWEQYILVTPESEFSRNLKALYKRGIEATLTYQIEPFAEAIAGSRKIPLKGRDIVALCQQIRARLARHSLREVWPGGYRKAKRLIKHALPVSVHNDAEATQKKVRHSLAGVYYDGNWDGEL